MAYQGLPGLGAAFIWHRQTRPHSMQRVAPMLTDSKDYLAKKRSLAKFLTLYGRKPVLEALNDATLVPSRLHMADSNQTSGIVAEILTAAKKRKVECVYHSREALARISKNRQQDQGVALDVACPGFDSFSSFASDLPERCYLLALDNVTNPQNLGMIIRSVSASPATGLLLPEKGCARLDSLVIKASAGTLFKARIIRCDSLAEALTELRQHDVTVYGLDARAPLAWPAYQPAQRSVFVLGNETHGLSPDIARLCTTQVAIPMRNGVESLNVSIAASLIAFHPLAL